MRGGTRGAWPQHAADAPDDSCAGCQWAWVNKPPRICKAEVGGRGTPRPCSGLGLAPQKQPCVGLWAWRQRGPVGLGTDQSHHSVRSLCVPDFSSGVFTALIMGGRGAQKTEQHRVREEGGQGV